MLHWKREVPPSTRIYFTPNAPDYDARCRTSSPSPTPTRPRTKITHQTPARLGDTYNSNIVIVFHCSNFNQPPSSQYRHYCHLHSLFSLALLQPAPTSLTLQQSHLADAHTQATILYSQPKPEGIIHPDLRNLRTRPASSHEQFALGLRGSHKAACGASTLVQARRGPASLCRIYCVAGTDRRSLPRPVFFRPSFLPWLAWSRNSGLYRCLSDGLRS